ncbi:MAG: aminotransferase class V-fold PLP-dependent enzyme [Candidatus Woesearchaeota archaeon]
MKKEFPLLNNSNIVYLDSAATTQKPQVVIDSIKDFYEKNNANIHRGLYKLSADATQLYDDSKKVVADFIGASADEIIFTKNATEALNIVANGISVLSDRREIVLSELEHHANIVPWLLQKGFTIKYIPLKGYDLDYDEAEKLITEKTAIVSTTFISNVFGTIIDVERLAKIAHSKGSLVCIDGTQSLVHAKVDVKKINCDFFACSAHKAFGPMGIGALYVKSELIEKVPPLLFGGDMIETVTFSKATWAKVPDRFEAGTQNVSGAIGFSTALKYIMQIGIDNIKTHDDELLNYALLELNKIEGIKIYHEGKGAPIISFTLDGIHPHDIGSILGDKDICVRGGHHCAMPLMNKLGVVGTVRASFSIYNTKEDVDELVKGVKKVQEVFNG